MNVGFAAFAACHKRATLRIVLKNFIVDTKMLLGNNEWMSGLFKVMLLIRN